MSHQVTHSYQEEVASLHHNRVVKHAGKFSGVESYPDHFAGARSLAHLD